MDCSQAQILMAPHILGDADLTAAELEGLETHLRECPACPAEYRQTEQVILAVRGLPTDLLEQALHGSLGEEARSAEPVEETCGLIVVEDGSERSAGPSLITERTKASGRANMFRRLGRVGALAACIALVVSGALVFYSFTRRDVNPAGTTPAGMRNATADTASKRMGMVVRLDAEGRARQEQPVLAGELLAAGGDERLRLRIWARHEITIEPGTRLAVNRSGEGGCVVALSGGRITASVNRAGGEGVFRVSTPQAELVITGTVFTVTATAEQTLLSVSHGTVQMSTRQGGLQAVSAGQAFATDGVALCRVEPHEIDPLKSVFESVVDPAASVRQSSWYRQRFAPLLHLRDFLVKQGVDADEMTMLAISADLWCLQYPKNPQATKTPYIHRKAGLERAANYYGYQVEWLTPADGGEAASLINKALNEEQLVLAYGRGDKTVEAVNAESADNPSHSTSWRYRFLGEDGSSVSPLCRVTRSVTEQVASRQELSRQSLTDRRNLLQGIDDVEYLIGRVAVEAWSNKLRSEDRISLNDPLLKALDILAKLGPVCEEQLAGVGLVRNIGGGISPYKELSRCIDSVFTKTAFEVTSCEKVAYRTTDTGFIEAVNEIAQEYK